MSKKHEVPISPMTVGSRDIHAAILAGGSSRRFGSDKCLAHLPGEDATFVERIVRACQDIVDRVVIIGPERVGLVALADAWVADLIVDEGPLVGLQTGLHSCSAPYLLLASCDQPFLTSAVLERLLDRRQEADIVVYAGARERVDPFPGCFYVPAARPAIDELIHTGERSLQAAFRSPLSVLKLAPEPGEREALRDIDTRSDLLGL